MKTAGQNEAQDTSVASLCPASNLFQGECQLCYSDCVGAQTRFDNVPEFGDIDINRDPAVGLLA